MAKTAKTEGECTFCGKRSSRGGISRHLQTCPERKAAIAAANATPGARETLIHLQVQNAEYGDYWLHLEVRGRAPLEKLDDYLRAIWLECCGHLSRFSHGGWAGEEEGMERKAQDVLREGVTLTHIYDFGSSTETSLRVVGIREGRPLGKRPVLLMARNEMPAAACSACGEPGTRLCVECMYDMVNPVLCEAHAATHPHDEYGEPLPLVNSPRVGVCGYEGPAEPPY